MSKETTLNIRTIEELRSEMTRVEARIMVAENDLRERWNRLPAESVKAATGSVVTLVLANGLGSVLLKIVTTLVGNIRKAATKEGEKTVTGSGIWGNLLQLGLIPIIELFYNILNNRKKNTSKD